MVYKSNIKIFLTITLPALFVLVILFNSYVLAGEAKKAAEKKVDPATGLIVSEGWEHVKTHCLACHSSKLIIQNRLTKERWIETIRWMQKEQGLWNLGDSEPIIVNYLAENYGIPPKIPRRKPLQE